MYVKDDRIHQRPAPGRPDKQPSRRPQRVARRWKHFAGRHGSPGTGLRQVDARIGPARREVVLVNGAGCDLQPQAEAVVADRHRRRAAVDENGAPQGDRSVETRARECPLLEDVDENQHVRPRRCSRHELSVLGQGRCRMLRSTVVTDTRTKDPRRRTGLADRWASAPDRCPRASGLRPRRRSTGSAWTHRHPGPGSRRSRHRLRRSRSP